MLERMDRVQLAVRDGEAAGQTFADLLGAVRVRSDSVTTLGAQRTVMQVGVSEVELLEPAGDGEVAAFLAARGEGLFAAGYATRDVNAVAARLDAHAAPYTRERDQLLLPKGSVPGMRMVISPVAERAPVGVVRFLYESTPVVADWQAARDRLSTLFNLHAGRFCPIESRDWGYVGVLTMFDPPARLDRIEVVTPHDSTKAMGRFHAKHGDELYMCYVEADDVSAIAQRLDHRGGTYLARGDGDRLDGLWIHPTALHGVLMGVSRTSFAWSWSCHPELVEGGAPQGTH